MILVNLECYLCISSSSEKIPQNLVSSYKLQVKSKKLEIKNYRLQVTSYKLQIASY